jgi:hypothetical protein
VKKRELTAKIEEYRARHLDDQTTITGLRWRIESLESLRPVWAMGHTSDSIAAQSSANALAQLWKLLGATNQTEAVARVKGLK